MLRFHVEDFSSFHGFGGLVRMIWKDECGMARKDNARDLKVDRLYVKTLIVFCDKKSF